MRTSLSSTLSASGPTGLVPVDRRFEYYNLDPEIINFAPNRLHAGGARVCQLSGVAVFKPVFHRREAQWRGLNVFSCSGTRQEFQFSLQKRGCRKSWRLPLQLKSTQFGVKPVGSHCDVGSG